MSAGVEIQEAPAEAGTGSGVDHMVFRSQYPIAVCGHVCTTPPRIDRRGPLCVLCEAIANVHGWEWSA